MTAKRTASVNQNTSWIYKKVTNPPGGRICDFFVYHPICIPSNCCLVFVNSVKMKFYNPVAQRLGFFLNPGWVRAMGDMANAANRIKKMFSRIAVPSRTTFIPHRPRPKLLLGPASTVVFLRCLHNSQQTNGINRRSAKMAHKGVESRTPKRKGQIAIIILENYERRSCDRTAAKKTHPSPLPGTSLGTEHPLLWIRLWGPVNAFGGRFQSVAPQPPGRGSWPQPRWHVWAVER